MGYYKDCDYKEHKKYKMPEYRAVRKEIAPLIDYGVYEATEYGVKHAIEEVAMIAYLVGKGYDVDYAHAVVESWEDDEEFYGSKCSKYPKYKRGCY